MAWKFGKKKSSWEQLSAKPYDETIANRDVYETQQLERTRLEGTKPRWPWNLFALVIGLLVFAASWMIASMGEYMVTSMTWSMSEESKALAPKPYYVSDSKGFVGGGNYYEVNAEGVRVDENHPYEDPAFIEEPQWHIDQRHAYEAAKPSTTNMNGAMGHFAWWKFLLSLLVGGGFFGFFQQKFSRMVDSQNAMTDMADINQHEDDQHIAVPEEIQTKYDWFPDVGAHSSVLVSSMISHMALSNKGLKKIDMVKHVDKTILDEEGNVVAYAGEPVLDEDGYPVIERVPMIDEDFMEALFEASGLPDEKALRKRYDTTKIDYNPGNGNRDKLKGYDKVSDLINGDWTFPEYELQRPGGAYIVDTAPVNTMVLAITRAGKGQTVIEPTLDMWTRELNPNNMVVNDPKGELLVKFYVPATVRGFQVVQFNLINPMKTDIYNPLGMAAEAAREGDSTKCAMYVENIAEVFFPLDGGEDPVWPNAANNAFKRAAYGLIDFYLEEERELRLKADRTGMSQSELEILIDDMWGKVTLYNCYQLFVQLTSQKKANPYNQFAKESKSGKYDHLPKEEQEALLAKFEKQSELWEDKPEVDLLSLYFTCTDRLPTNSMRTLVANANNALKAMAGADKMMASVYGIAITAMSFFADPTISALTSGAPSQNTDLAGLSFPRRFGVRFAPDYCERHHLIGLQVKWDAFGDENFTESLGKDFEHEDIISREGWAKYYFKGIFPEDTAYIRLRIMNPASGQLIKTMRFRFEKAYQTSLDGDYYITDPILGTRLVKNGTMVELVPNVKKLKAWKAAKEAGKKVGPEPKKYVTGHTRFMSRKLTGIGTDNVEVDESAPISAIRQMMVRYSEKPRMVFLVTPPHLMKYAKLILILIKQLVDLNFDQSYMTKSNQKPLYKTRFMLDELGNLQSEGHGISGFETMLSIGLGQEQQFTLILQTLQQLRDVYGDSIDKIVQGNAQPLSSLIATPSGWKRMGDIAVGDDILTPAGAITQVRGVYPKGVRTTYRIRTKDGRECVACGEHLWKVKVV